jgi:hypothetical protein
MTMVRAATVAAAVALVGIAAFQLALALGAPWGRAAWGGAQAGTLPTNLRVASGVAIIIWTFAALIVLRRGGWELLGLPAGLARVGIWVLFGLLLLGALMNVASSSPWERYVWGPYALLVSGLCLVVARGTTN